MPHFRHTQYGMFLKVKKDTTPLPTDRRRKPYPTIRKWAMKNIKTWGDYSIAIMGKGKVALEIQAAKAFNSSFFNRRKKYA